MGASRRRFVQGAAAAALLGACGAFAAERSVLAPGNSYAGARLLNRVDPQGLPAPGPDTFGPMTFFVFPVGVAATPFDIYIADAGLSALFRYDPMLDAMAPVPGVRISPQSRIAAVQDGSVIVADGRLAPPRRYARSGRLIQTIDPQNTGSRFDDIVADNASGRYFGLDRVQRRVDEIQPLGRSSAILPEDLLPKLPTFLALDRQILYAAGQDCQCVVAIDLFRRDKHILVEDIAQVGAMAAGEGWLAVADSADRIVRVYRDLHLVADPTYESLKLVNPQSFSICRGVLYVADAGARRIATFRLRS